MEHVTLVNRTSKPLFGTWDGRSYKIMPGKNSYPRIVAQKLKDQNPVMGTGMYGDIDTLYLCGIEEDNDDCSPREQSGAVESLNRRQFAKPVEVVAGVTGIHSRHDVASAPLSNDSSFVKP